MYREHFFLEKKKWGITESAIFFSIEKNKKKCSVDLWFTDAPLRRWVKKPSHSLP